MSSKPKLERVKPALAREAYRIAGTTKIRNELGRRQRAWSEYICLTYRSTGNLAPGCDAKDLYAWLIKEFGEVATDGL